MSAIILFLAVLSLLTCFVGLWIGLLVYPRLMPKNTSLRNGRELKFKLPVCVCNGCIPKTGTLESRGRELMEKTTLYRQLLQKYPDAKILKIRTIR